MSAKTQALSWAETRARLRADRARLTEMLDTDGRRPLVLALHPSALCVLLHRVSHYLFCGGHRYLARVFWHLNAVWTGADISSPSDLGPGLLIVNPVGAAVSGNAGRNLTLMPLAGLGSELGRREDIGAGPGLPVLGDDVFLEPLAGVLGPAQIGDRVRICAGAVPTHDVPEDMVVRAPAPRLMRRRDL